jgi:hypothetical protein
MAAYTGNVCDVQLGYHRENRKTMPNRPPLLWTQSKRLRNNYSNTAMSLLRGAWITTTST